MTSKYSDGRVDELFAILKKRRFDLGLSLSQVVAGVGTSKSAVSDWENLKRCPSFRNTLKWIKFLGLSIEIAEDWNEVR